MKRKTLLPEAVDPAAQILGFITAHGGPDFTGRVTLVSAGSVLPNGCPLLAGEYFHGQIPPGCKYERRLLQRMLKTGALPLPGGQCPLRCACGLGGGNSDR